MYGGNPFRGKKRRKRSKSDFSTQGDTTLDLLLAASRKLKIVEREQKSRSFSPTRNQSTPPRSFYTDPGQLHHEHFVIPIDTSHHHTDVSRRPPTTTRTTAQRSVRDFDGEYSSHLNKYNNNDGDHGDYDDHDDHDHNDDFKANSGEDQGQRRNRSPSRSMSTVAHDSPARRRQGDFSSSSSVTDSWKYRDDLFPADGAWTK